MRTTFGVVLLLSMTLAIDIQSFKGKKPEPEVCQSEVKPEPEVCQSEVAGPDCGRDTDDMVAKACWDTWYRKCIWAHGRDVPCRNECISLNADKPAFVEPACDPNVDFC